MKTRKPSSVLSKSGLGLLGKSALIATGVVLSSTMFSTANAVSLSPETPDFSSQNGGGRKSRINYFLTEDAGSINVEVSLDETFGSGIGDIGGIWFNIADEIDAKDLTFTSPLITGIQHGKKSFGNDAKLGGNFNSFDVGLKIGTPNNYEVDDVRSVTFTIDHKDENENLNLSLFSEQMWATSLRQVGHKNDHSDRNGNIRHSATAPVYQRPPSNTSSDSDPQPEGTWRTETLDFEGLAEGTIIDDEFMGVTISQNLKKYGNGNYKEVTLFNTNCNPNYSNDSDAQNVCATDEDLATGGSLNTEARGNVLIVQENNSNANSNNSINETPDDNRNGGRIRFDFDEDVILQHIEFLDYDKTDSNNITFTTYDKDGSFLKKYKVKRNHNDKGDIVELDDKNNVINTFNNAVNQEANNEDTIGFDEAKLQNNPFAEYVLANNGLGNGEKYENSVWDFYFGEGGLGGLEGARSLEVDFGGTSGAISELTYKKFTAKPPRARVPEPSSIAALAFIGGGIILSRRRQSK